jgi:hypothetical protein
VIVTPDFLDHWKTRLLVDITKDESVLLCLIRLWAYCHTSRQWVFPDMTPEILAAICRWGTRTPAGHDALVQAGFVNQLNKGYAVHDWNKVNSQLIQRWQSGAKGGRPRKSKNESKPAETGRFHPDTQTETDKTRQDGLDQNSTYNVNLVKNAPETDLTKLTANAASIERIAREIANNKHGWSWDNCEVKPSEILSASIKKVLRSYTGQLAEKTIHDCWREAVICTHKAVVDDLVKQTPVGYCVACFKDRLEKATQPPK